MEITAVKATARRGAAGGFIFCSDFRGRRLAARSSYKTEQNRPVSNCDRGVSSPTLAQAEHSLAQRRDATRSRSFDSSKKEIVSKTSFSAAAAVAAVLRSRRVIQVLL